MNDALPHIYANDLETKCLFVTATSLNSDWSIGIYFILAIQAWRMVPCLGWHEKILAFIVFLKKT